MELNLPQSLLELSMLLAGAVLVGLLARRAHIPVTVVLAVGGFLVGTLGGRLEIVELLRGEGFEQALVNVFLPILIFEASFALTTREFMRNLAAIVVLATVAVALAAGLVGLALHSLLGVPLLAALLFGVLISATDPVAVVAVFRDLGVPERLLTLVEGESMLNDGVAIVLFQIMLVAALGGGLSIAGGLASFGGVFFGGAVIGALIGAAAVLVLPLLQRLPAAALSVAVAYGSAVLAQAVFGFSGVMATLAAGVVMGGMVGSRAAPEVRDILHELWDALSYIANALLFLFVGLIIDASLITDNVTAIAIAIAAVLLARPVAIVPLVALLGRMGDRNAVGRRDAAVLVWGGLRGGVALALALALPAALPQRELFIAMAGGVVLATLLLNATTISTLVHFLGLDEPSQGDRYLGAVARLFGIQAARGRLDRLAFDDAIVRAHLVVAEAEARDELERLHLSDEEELRVLTMRGLAIQRETYQGLGDAGMLPPIAARTLMQEIDDEADEVAAGRLDVDKPRRAALPWYGRVHRRVLGALPEPAGEDLTKVGYIEVSARRLAAQRASEELERFKGLPGIHGEQVDAARKLFTHWEGAASKTLETLDEQAAVDQRLLHRRQAEALSRLAAAEALNELAQSGLLSQAVVDRAAERIALEIGHHTT